MQGKKGMSVANIVFSHSPFWVQVWGVPFELMTEDTARDIGNRIGIFWRQTKDLGKLIKLST